MNALRIAVGALEEIAGGDDYVAPVQAQKALETIKQAPWRDDWAGGVSRSS